MDIVNKYELRKTIGFELKPVKIASLENLNLPARNQNRTTHLKKFIEEIEDFISCFEKFIFIDHNKVSKTDKLSEEKKNKIELKDIDIKYDWLINYTKDNFYSWYNKKYRRSKYNIKRVSYLKDSLKNCIKEWKSIIEELKKDLSAPQENLKRRSKTAFFMKQFSTKQVFHFIEKFVLYAESQENEKQRVELENSLKKISLLLAQLREIYLPYQSKGLVLAKASFNFYTIDKREINYEDEEKNCDSKINASIENGHIDSQYHQGIKKWIENSENIQIKQMLEDVQLTSSSNLKSLNLELSCKLMKIYKSKQKQLFDEDVSRHLSYKEMTKKHSLFILNDNKKDEYDKLLQNTKQIEEINLQIENIKKSGRSNEYKIREKTQEKNKLIQKKQNFSKYYPEKYINLCKSYNKIAKSFGRLKAEKRGIRQEKEESQLLNYWGLIIEDNGKHELLLIHKDKRKKAKQEIDDLPEYKDDSKDFQKIHVFYSLTLRALKKLCFGAKGIKDTDFLINIKQELNEYKKIEGIFSFKDKKKNKIDEKNLIKFYQEVLKSNYAKKFLEISKFQNLQSVLNDTYQTLNEFQSALEKACYIKKTLILDNETKNKLLEMTDSLLFKITSYDLSLCEKDIKNRPHTNLWNEFWSVKNQDSYYPVRLNPEISVLKREKKEDKIETGRYNKVIRNRFLTPQWNLKTNLTLNATSERVDLSFRKTEDIKSEVRKFNNNFDKHVKQNKKLFYYGVDQGLRRLATLYIIRENSNSEKGFSIHPMEIDKLKEKHYLEKEKGHIAYKNPSYFFDKQGSPKPNLFEKKESPTIDLTTAKLISGKIIENGDIFTYLKFKELSAKRRLFKNKYQMDEKKVFISNDKKTVDIKITQQGKPKIKPIYYFREDFKQILSIEEIKDKLQKYLDNIQNESLALTEDKINHLKNAISSNIVGILFFLHKKNPGLIILEREQKGKRNEENIVGKLEWALYKKFQTEGLVPPCLKEVDLLLNPNKNNKKRYKSNNVKQEINNFGLIHFIPPDKTSKICPKCNKENKNHKQQKQEDWFKCEKCNFDTKEPPKELLFLDDTDKLAAYNICKKGREFQLNKKDKK